jgi:hypothetical protein
VKDSTKKENICDKNAKENGVKQKGKRKIFKEKKLKIIYQ